MITVLGATGNIGRHVVDALLASGERPRIVTRDRSRAPWSDDEVEVCVGDVQSSAVRAAAFDRADRAFTLSFVEERPPVLSDIADAARQAGVGRIVLLSSIGAASSISIGSKHAEAEGIVRRSGVAWTFLRPGYLMSNTLRWAASVKREGRVAVPAADGAIAPIAESDIALAAAISLKGGDHEGRTYVLTGDPITARQQIEILGELLGRRIECIDEDFDLAATRLVELGRPSWVVDGLRAMWTEIREGRGADRDDAFTRLSGRAATTYRSWASAHRSAFE